MKKPDPIQPVRPFPGLIRIADKPGQNLEITGPIWASPALRSAGCWWEPDSRTWQAGTWELPLIVAALEAAGYVVHHDDHRLPATERRAARNASLARARQWQRGAKLARIARQKDAETVVTQGERDATTEET